MSQHRLPPAWRNLHLPRVIVASSILLVLGATLLLALAKETGRADPGDADQVARGRRVYNQACASCHGANLAGQPNWKERRPDGTRPAPPHDETGHTWHHPDALLFDIIREGGQVYALPGESNGMPAFGDRLSDEEIWAVLAYIKSTWPPDIQRRQREISQQNP